MIVVGARVAGSTLAALLGDAGVSVLLLDRARFPSTTPSTHFFRGAGLVGGAPAPRRAREVLALGCPPLTREFDYEDGGRGRGGPAAGAGRRRLLPLGPARAARLILLQRARAAATVEVVEGAQVSDVLWDASGRRAWSSATAAARGRRWSSARTGATRWSPGRSMQAVEHEAPPLRALYYRYVAGFRGPGGDAPDAAEFSLLGDEMAYVFPSDAGLTCVAISVNLETFRWLRRDPGSGHAERLAPAPRPRPAGGAATADGRVAGCGPERFYVRVPHGPGWALVGDAALHQDPWSGLGMDMAGVHAGFLAEAIVGWLDGGAGERAAMTGYHRRRDAHALPAYHETLRGAADLRRSSPDAAALVARRGPARWAGGVDLREPADLAGDGHQVVRDDAAPLRRCRARRARRGSGRPRARTARR